MPQVTVELPEDFGERIIMDALGLDEDGLRPAAVVISAPHAAMMEFGTPPATSMGPAKIRAFHKSDGTVFYEEVSDSFWELYKWAERHASQLEPYDFARAVHSKIMKEGLEPHPFIRPALEEFKENLLDILREEGSLYGAAGRLADMIWANLSNGLPGAPRSDTGALEDSISIEYADESGSSDEEDPRWSDYTTGARR